MLFEDALPIINEVVERRRKNWTLNAVAGWYTYDDFSQEVKRHLYKKWHLYNDQYDLRPWVDRVVMNQMYNKLESLYHSHKKPCLSCEYNLGGDECELFTHQCSECPKYLNWIRTGKQSAQAIKMPMSLQASVSTHTSSDINQTHLGDFIADKEPMDLEALSKEFCTQLENHLSPFEARVFKYTYISGYSDRDASKFFGYDLSVQLSGVSGQKNSAGIRVIKEIKNKIYLVAKQVSQDFF